MAGEWENLGAADFTRDGGQPVSFPCKRRIKKGGNRLARRARPYRSGVKIDHIGEREDEFDLVILFSNEVTEGLDTPASPMWPNRLRELEEAIRYHETGTLNLPWEKSIRCFADRWDITADSDQLRDGEIMNVTFIRDNEDSLDASAVENVSVKANVQRLVQEATFDLEREGMYEGSIEDWTEFAAGVEAAIQAPGEYYEDLDHKVRRLERAGERIVKAFSTEVEGRTQGNDPASSVAIQKIREVMDLIRQALREAIAQHPKSQIRTYESTRNIYDIAREVQQPPEVLIALNPHIEDLGAIPPRTPVRILAHDR